MATVIGNNRVRLNDGSVVNAQTGGWYDGQQFWNGSLSSAGQINQQSNQQGAGQQVSNEVASQSGSNNVSYIQEQIRANQMQSPTQIALPNSSSSQEYVTGLNDEVARARQSLLESLNSRQSEVDARLDTLRKREQGALDSIGNLTNPFREELERTERERLYVNKNFEENQTLVDELDTLLTEGNNLIRQAQSVTGLAAVRNPRIQRAMDDVAARAGVIEAVINARNGQIAVAENMIDRSINAIAADRQDQISYYETIISLNRQDIISLDTQSQKIAEEQLNLKKQDLASAQASADYIKNLLVNPQTAALMGEAGVKLTDSIDQINMKITSAQQNREVREMNNAMGQGGYVEVYNPTASQKSSLTKLTDAKGQVHYYKKSGGISGNRTAEEFILSQLKTGDATNQTEELPTLSSSSYSLIEQAMNEILAPQVSPVAGIGSAYYDSYGRKWVYERTGWRLVG